MTVEGAAQVVLSFSGAFESAHHGHPDFRTPKGIFATLRPEQGRSVLRLPIELADAIVSERPDTHQIVSRSGGKRWVSVDLSNVEVETFQVLAEAAFNDRQKK